MHILITKWSSIQKQDESMEQFYGAKTAIAENFKLKKLEAELILDTFIFNKNSSENRRDLLKETVSPEGQTKKKPSYLIDETALSVG